MNEPSMRKRGYRWHTQHVSSWVNDGLSISDLDELLFTLAPAFSVG